MRRRIVAIAITVLVMMGLIPMVASAATVKQDTSQSADEPLMLEAPPLTTMATITPSTTWYTSNPSATTFTVNSAADLAGLANLVNAGTADFSGKTILVSSSVTSINFYASTVTPIGTAVHPFKGTFDGQGCEFANFSIDGTANENVGFFGYVGTGGAIKNVTIAKNGEKNPNTIKMERDAASNAVLENIGLLVGYCGGTISNCTSKGTITITSAVEQQSKTEPFVVKNVGGVAGSCVFNMTDCDFTGKITVSATSAPVKDVESEYLITNVGGIVGFLGDETKEGTTDTHIPATDPSAHGTISDCTNTGTLSLSTPAENGVDRFNMPVSAHSQFVGGIVGYSQGSIYRCTNGTTGGESKTALQSAGYLSAEGATPIGGICGSLRSTQSPNYSQGGGDDGDAADPIVIEDCVNYGDIYGLAACGGIVGQAGTYTTVTGCLNLNKAYTINGQTNDVSTYVIGTRWNKPAPSGIAGRSYGVISYCANFAIVESGTWTEGGEASRTLDAGSGYFASGICGMLLYYTTTTSDGDTVRATPLPEVYGCYNAGQIVAKAGMRQRGIVGNNDGYVHDNVLLAGMVDNNKIVYGDEAGDEDSSGTASHNEVLDSTALKTSAAVSWLNTSADASGWNPYWALSDGTLNKGYPVLDSQVTWTPTSLVGATAELISDAEYSGSESIPTCKVTTAGGTVLTQGVDFKVVPQTGAVEVSTAGAHPYNATIIGIGSYTGTLTNAVAYGIVKGDLSACKVTVNIYKFNWEAQTPTASDVVVKCPNGTVVSSDEYTFALASTAVNVGEYDLTVTAKDSSTHFYGTTTGEFRIRAASLMTDAKYSSISYLGTSYDWKTSVSDSITNPSTTLPYSGVAVEPTVGTVTYMGKTLVEGRDYRIVYGNPNSDDGSGQSNDNYNLGKAGGRTIGCVTVRYISGANFSSYDNMFFWITDAGAGSDIANATVDAPDVIYDGLPKEPVKVYYGAKLLTKDTDYTITYSSNTAIGTASYTITGKGVFTGQKTGTFNIKDGVLYDFAYTYSGDGTAANPYVATVTGVNYHGIENTFDMTIPATTVNAQDGKTYAVTAIGDKAFGGSGSSDFTGSETNLSKQKIARVTIPAGITTIGAYAFGSASSSVVLSLASVTFAEGSQLTTIGDSAFQGCVGLTSIGIPDSVATVGASAFKGCTGITAIELPTGVTAISASTFDSCTKLSSFNVHSSVTNIGNKAFYGCTALKTFAFDKNSQLTAIGDSVFQGDGGLTTLDLPDRIETIGASAFKNCTGLTGISLPESLGAVSASTFENCTKLSSCLVGTSVTSIGNRAFYGCTSLKAFNFKVGSKITTIGNSAFMNCTSLASFDFPENVATIDSWAFKGCAGLKTLTFETADATLPSSVATYTNATNDGAFGGVTGATVCGFSSATAVQKIATDNAPAKAASGSNGGTSFTFKTLSGSLKDAVITAVPTQTYTGSAISPALTVTLGGKALTPNTDYTVTYRDNVTPGTASFTISGMGSYAGSQSGTFTIAAAKSSAPVNLTAAASNATVSLSWEAPASDGGSGITGYRIYRDGTLVGTVDATELTYEAAGLANGTSYVFTVVAVNDEGEGESASITATPSKLTRLSGAERLATMEDIVATGFTEKCDTAILATGWSFPDALAASGLAGLCRAPVLLVDGTATNLDGTPAKAEMDRLGVTKVIICGGANSVSASIESSLAAAGYTVTRASGAGRVQTALDIYAKGCNLGSGWGDTVVVATSNNYADALSVSPFAYASGSPIILTATDGTLTEEAQSVIKGGGFKHAVVVGGVNSVVPATEDWLKAALGTDAVVRLAGAGRYATSAAIADFSCGQGDYAAYPARFGYTPLTYTNPGIATGLNYPDALAGAAFCGKKGSVLILADDISAPGVDRLASNKDSIAQGYVFGGANTVKQELMDAISAKIE